MVRFRPRSVTHCGNIKTIKIFLLCPFSVAFLFLCFAVSYVYIVYLLEWFEYIVSKNAWLILTDL